MNRPAPRPPTDPDLRDRLGESARRDQERREEFAAALREQNLRLENELAAFRQLLDKDRSRLTEMTDSLSRLEAENHAITARFVALEQQKTEFANMFVTCYRLHSTLERPEILAAIQEIVANIVGSEEMVVFETEPGGEALIPVHQFGVPAGRWRRVTGDQGRIGAALHGGDISFARPHAVPYPGEEQLSAVIPLRADGKIVGAVAIFRLLQQKNGYESLDHELLELLSNQAGVALRASGLASREAAQS